MPDRFPLEFAFLDLIRQYQAIGYGNMMQIISREWYRDPERKYGPGTGGGAFVAGETFASLPEEEQSQYLAMLAADPLFQEPGP